MASQPARPEKPRRATADLESGRAHQKARTRQALVDAAMSFIRDGQDFSVADVAEAAQIGRTTAYCYFPTKESLFAQAVLTFVASLDYPDFEQLFATTSDVEARVQAVVEVSDASLTRHEDQYRAMLRLSLESEPADDLPRRPGYRQQWLADALAPVRDSIDGSQFDQLVAALSLCVGIEAHVALRDVCGLSNQEARRVKLWASEAILRAGLGVTAASDE